MIYMNRYDVEKIGSPCLGMTSNLLLKLYYWKGRMSWSAQTFGVGLTQPVISALYYAAIPYVYNI